MSSLVTPQIPLDRIDPNPFQPRTAEDPEHIAQLAASILETGGLLQVPLARPAGDGRYQLTFGHSRLAALKKLLADGYKSFATMPLDIRTLSDQQMFELAVRENNDRRDLSPVEAARAMRTYREQFGKSSREIGELFGLSESAVRNKLRLLDLPEGAQAQLAGGEISEGTARKLLSAAAVLPPKQIEELGQRLASGGFSNPEKVSSEISSAMYQAPETFKMWDHYQKDPARGGHSLWPLDWAPEGFQPPTAKTIARGLKDIYPQLAGGGPEFVESVRSKLLDGETVSDIAAAYNGFPVRFLTMVEVLMRPPACTKCPLYVRMDGDHWCALKPCWEQKKQAWLHAETARLVEELEIPLYDPRADGKLLEACPPKWQSSHDEWKTWFAERADHLRLRPKWGDYSEHSLTDSRCVEVISVRPELAEKRAQEKAAEAAGKKSEAEQQRQLELYNQLVAGAAMLAAPRLLGQMASLTILELVARQVAWNIRKRPEDQNDDERRMELQGKILLRIMDHDLPYEYRRKPLVETALYLEAKLEEWGAPVPGYLVSIAEQLSDKGVSVETVEEAS